MFIKTNKGCNHLTGEYYIQVEGEEIFNITLVELQQDHPSYDPSIARKIDKLFEDTFKRGREAVKAAMLSAVKSI
jgi:hypothetical protein